MFININSFFFIIGQKKILANFFSILQLCTRLPSSYDSDLGPSSSRKLRGLPSSDGYFNFYQTLCMMKGGSKKV